MGTAVPIVSELQQFAQANVNELGRTVVPLFSAALILARKPGAKLSAEEEDKFASALPAPVLDLLKRLIEIIPEDPRVTHLKRIAESLEAIENHVNAIKAASASAAAAEASSRTSSSPTSNE